jgi:hypothetical protein
MKIDYSIKTLKRRIRLAEKIINENWDSILRYFNNVSIEKQRLPSNRLLRQLANYILYWDKQPTYRQRKQFGFEKNADEFTEYKYNLYAYPPSSNRIGDFEISDFRNLLNVDFFDIDSWKPVLKLLRFNNMVSENVDRVIRIFYKCYRVNDFTPEENKIIRIYQKKQVKNSTKEFCIIKNIDIANKLNIEQSEVFSIIRSICKKLSDAYEILFTDYYYTFLVKGKYKTCFVCGKIKLIQQFYKNSNTNDGYQNICIDCMDENYKICSKCGQKLNKDMFFKKKDSRDGLQTWCKLCDIERKNN